jgi:predicted AlkP superfamily phosphohydrolase/phosphomutase
VTARLLVIGLDGGDDRILAELMDAGRLPALASIRQRGAAVPLETEADVMPEAAWPVLVSGAGPQEDDMFHFYTFDPETMEVRFRREAGPEREPFWLHLPGRGEGALVSEIPELHPHPESRAEESCCWHSHAPAHRPFFTSRRLAGTLRAHGSPLALTDPDYSRAPSLEHDLALADRLVRSAGYRARALRAAARGRTSVCAVFHELHTAVHCLGHHYDPEHWYRPFDPEPELLFRVYEAVDEALAPLLEDFADANVAVVAARGSRPADTAGDLLEELLARGGLLARAGGAATAGHSSVSPTERLRRLVPPEFRRRIALRVLPEAMQHRLAARAFRERYAWPATRAFPLPTWTIGLVRVNVAGREAAGIVPLDEFDSVLQEVTRLIQETVDADTGAPLAARVIALRREMSARDPRPDLVVEWAPTPPSLAARHPRLGTWSVTRAPTHAWSHHRSSGLVLLAGPGVRRTPAADEQDRLGLASTLLALAGLRDRPSASPAWSDLVAR